MTCPPTEPQDLCTVYILMGVLVGLIVGGVVRR